jgi:cytochrome c553
MIRRPLLAAALIALAAVSASAGAAGDPERGAELATACLGCHGIAGYRNAYPSYRVPMLGGQKGEYIVLALQAYRAGTRPHATMQAQAASLSDQDMQDIAAFIASQGDVESAAAPAAPAGVKEKAAVCAACHGEAGVSSAPTWPNLAGQHRDYLEHSIKAYRDKSRQDPVMQGQVGALTDDDVEALAEYYAGQSGLFTTHLKN